MTTALPPIMPQPAAPQSRDAAGLQGSDHRAPRAAAAETARAVRPVEAGRAATDPRLPARKDQPIGPPPAFAINLLQHMRETALDPPDPDAAEAMDEAPEPRPRREETPYPSAGQAPADDAVEPRVDIKL